MASEKQINANRLNAQKSTGPKSPEGKAKVALNRVKHGLTAQHLVLPDEDQSAFDGLLAALRLEWDPQSETEAFLVESLAYNQWRLLRSLRLEKAAFARHLAAHSAGTSVYSTPLSQENISRYEGRASRAYYRALDTLRKLQTARPTGQDCAASADAPSLHQCAAEDERKVDQTNPIAAPPTPAGNPAPPAPTPIRSPQPYPPAPGTLAS